MRSAIRTAANICSLPAVPTHDWTSQTANTLATLSPALAVGVCIAQLDEATSKINLISAGVSTQATNTTNTNELPVETLFLLDKLERLTTIGITLPAETCQRGLVAPLRTLDTNWQHTPLGTIFNSQGYQCPVIAIVPISQAHPGFVLITALAMNPAHPASTNPETIECLTDTLGQLVPILSEKAHTALEQVTNPKAWLTDREHEILDQLILGNSVHAIADTLGRSTHTVHDHVKNLHKKLGASSRGQLIANALGYSSSTQEHRTPAPNPMVLLHHAPLPELKPRPNNQVFAAQPQQPRTQARPLR